MSEFIDIAMGLLIIEMMAILLQSKGNVGVVCLVVIRLYVLALRPFVDFMVPKLGNMFISIVNFWKLQHICLCT